MRHHHRWMPIVRWLIPISIFLAMNIAGFAAEVKKDIEYSRAEGMSLRLDVSIPNGEGPFPAAILVHGGGWVRGDKRIDVTPLFKPLADAGIAWFSINYRLAADPLHFGVAIDDVDAAIRFVKDHAAEYRVDPDRIALIGESAGGQLAGMAALNSGVSVKAVVLLYAPTDLVSLLNVASELLPASILDRLKGTPLEGLLLSRLAQLSPITRLRAGMPPFLLIHGTADPLVPFEQSRAMCRKMESVGASCELFPVPGAGHAMRRWEDNPKISEPYKKEMVRWLLEQFGENPVTAI